jgi:PPOX class probable F420-dependent enzyme
MAMTLEEAFVFTRQHSQGVLVTLRTDGRPQISNIMYVAAGDVSVRISVTDSRAKTNNLRRDPRGALHVTSSDFWSYVVLDGAVALSPVAQSTDDAVVAELVDMYREARGDHPDWAEFRRAMVDQRRLVATLTAIHAYGQLGR